ncbi:CRISPR-associated endonuclease/helicase Cas3 [Ceratobasidium sp. 428]|nr:CRISPR-associated endonuclease/helicase Cas3 [Ceratobasidium sp. 428]
MLRLPRFSFVVAALTVVYAGILTLVVSTGSRDTWMSRLLPTSLDDAINLAAHGHGHHDQHVFAGNTTITVTKTQTVTATATATAVSVQTVVPKTPGPAYCKECSEDDLMCKEYGRHNLERSRGFEGTNERLKRILQKAASGQPINIGVLGGSVTHGHAVVHPQVWTDIFFDWWNATYPHEENVFVNGAVPATGTAYFSVCALEHIDESVDLVILELAINDLRGESSAMTYEWLIRSLLELPHKPAIISTHVFSTHFEYLATGGDNHLAVAQYYDIPYINLRHVLINHVLEHENLVSEFFRPQDPFPPNLPVDTRHMNRAGHKMMADLLIAYMQRQICRMAADAESPIPPFVSQNNLLPTLDTMEQIPRLRLFERYVPTTRTPSVHSTCMSARSKKHPLKPSKNNGWVEGTWNDKTYLLAREPGSSLTFDMHVGPMGMVELEYLRSKTFGLGIVRCWMGENEAGGTLIDGYWEENLNIARSATIAYGQTPGPSTVSCKILDTTNSPNGGHEFRMIALTSF